MSSLWLSGKGRAISGRSNAPFPVSNGSAFALIIKPVSCLSWFERIGERKDNNNATEIKMNIVLLLIFLGTFFKLPILRTVLYSAYN